MIAIRLQGRLGNQLFQYAFIITAANKLKTSFYIDQHVEPSIIDQYFAVNKGALSKVTRGIFTIKGFKNIFNYHLRKRYYQLLSKIYALPIYNYHFDITAADVTLQDQSIYIGYFQSESFFKDREELIKSSFTLKRKITTYFNRKYGNLYQHNRIITVHIRRTDYKHLSHLNLGHTDLSLPLNYYKKAMAKYDQQAVHFVFISDDIEFINKNFTDVKNKTISTDSEIVDFQHLLNADGCIISNSSFSWWGAWLNAKADKTVICPKYYLGYYINREYPTGIYPTHWQQIEY